MKGLDGGSKQVKVTLTHSILSIRVPEVRLSVSETVGSLKVALERRFGTSAGSMTLVLKDANEENIAVMNDDASAIGNFGVQDDFVIHCVDEDPNSILKSFEDTSAVQKYVMTDNDYDKLPSVLKSECSQVQRQVEGKQSGTVPKDKNKTQFDT